MGLFYRHINKRISNQSSIGCIIDGDSIVVDDSLKANLFNCHFASTGVIDNGFAPSPVSRVKDDDCLYEITVSEYDVLTAIKKMKSSLSCGPDGFPPILFKKLMYPLVRPLTLVFNQLLSVAVVPSDWKKAVIVPVFKKGAAGSVANYRPISLTSIMSKLLERVLSTKIIDHLLLNNLLSNEQHGFIKKRSTCTNLLECFNDWSLNVEFGFQTAVVYIDFAKAFDSVSHQKLLIKLREYGIRGKLLSWLSNFFSGRTHQTRINNILSDVIGLLSGVVQGSSIGPILFVIFIDNLIEALQQFGVKVKLFADDLKLYLRVLNSNDVNLLQRALDALVDWENTWQLSISVNKCSVLSIGKRTETLSSLNVHGQLLPINKNSVDLGVTVSDDLKPRTHINVIAAKAHQRANAILRCFVSKNINMLKRGFLVYVRPLLEYNSVIWSPSYVQDIDTIERVQRKFTKRLPGFKKLSYMERLHLLDLPSLELRRLHIDLIWCYKIIFGLVHINYEEFFRFNKKI